MRIAKVLFLISLVNLDISTIFAQLKVRASLCNNKVNPLAVSADGLHFSWELSSAENAQCQSAYQIVVSSSISHINSFQYDIWNSTKVGSSQSILLEYGGKRLSSARTYYWKVRVWDKKNQPSEWSSVQQFTTALFSDQDWANAKWIGYEELTDSMRVAPGVHFPEVAKIGEKCMQRSKVPLFRKTFNVEKRIKKALIFVSGLGQYELRINGQKENTSFLAPGWTYFDKTVLYNTYDITNKIKVGKNVLGFIVGNGFYYINRERYFKIASAFGFPKMICCMKILYEDGNEQNIISDESWKTSLSPISFSSIYGGEDYDARQEQKDWDTKIFNDDNWKKVLCVKPPLGKLMPEEDYPVKIMDSFSVKKISHPEPGKYVYDFGQNASGIVRLRIKGKKGQTVKLVPAELIDGQKLANQSASGEPYYFSYTLKGDSEEVYEPRFTYYGFRYVQVEGAVPNSSNKSTDLPVVLKLIALNTFNSSPQNGSFSCSNELFNKIYSLIKWAIKSNMQSVITDCPHREKLSWLEEDYLMGESIHYNFDIYNLYRKLVIDLIDAQYPEGFVPDIAPSFVVFKDGFLDSPEWGSACVVLPWLLYKWYGDKDILTKAYPMMKKYLAYLETKSDHHILSFGLGDWFDYGPKQPGEAQLTPKSLTATAIYFYDVRLLAEVAGVLDDPAARSQYESLATEIKHSFNNRFFNETTGIYSTGSQTAMAMPLCVGVVDDRYKKTVLKNLSDSIYANNKALTSGDIGFHFLIKALDDGGNSQLIYEMNNRDDVPGYGFQLKKGATALTESWPALDNVSNNHLMLGHIMEWLYSGIAGISQEKSSIAFRNIKIRPQPVGNITFANGHFHTPYGWITTFWKKEKGTFFLQIHVPVNSSATIYLPLMAKSKVYQNGTLLSKKHYQRHENVAVLNITSGNYKFKIK